MFRVDEMPEVMLSDASTQDEIAEIHFLVEASELAVVLAQGTLVLGQDFGFDANTLVNGYFGCGSWCWCCVTSSWCCVTSSWCCVTSSWCCVTSS